MTALRTSPLDGQALTDEWCSGFQSRSWMMPSKPACTPPHRAECRGAALSSTRCSASKIRIVDDHQPLPLTRRRSPTPGIRKSQHVRG